MTNVTGSTINLNIDENLVVEATVSNSYPEASVSWEIYSDRILLETPAEPCKPNPDPNYTCPPTKSVLEYRAEAKDDRKYLMCATHQTDTFKNKTVNA